MKIEDKKAYIPCKIIKSQLTNENGIHVRIDKSSDLYINSKLLVYDIDQPKPEIPQFVAEWIEECDLRFVNLSYIFGDSCPNEVKQWVSAYHNHKKILQALLFGYTVEKEKLYTVEIPNPNRNSKGCAKFRLEKLGDKVYLVKRKSKAVYQNKDSQKLTEQEIRKDFEWAWQWAKEVTE